MNRTDAIIAIDHACDGLEQAMAVLNGLGASYSMQQRLTSLLAKLEDLRVDVMQCDLLVEET